MWRLGVLFLLAGCELRGLTRSQLYGAGADAAVVADGGDEPPDTAPAVVDPGPDAQPPDLGPDVPVAPAEGIIVSGFIGGLCHQESVMVGGAGFHTCSYPGKNSYRLRIRGIPPGTHVEIGTRLSGYLPDPATAIITLEATGNTQDFRLSPASGTCDTVPDAAPCVCVPAEGCDPS